MLLLRKSLLLLVPAGVVADGDYIITEGPYRERRVGAEILDDIARVQDLDTAIYFVRRYGRLTPPGFYPAGEPLDLFLHWGQWLPAAVVILQLSRLDRQIPRPIRAAYGAESSSSASLIEGAAGVINSALADLGISPALAFDSESRQWVLGVATGPRGRVEFAIAALLHFALARVQSPPDSFHFAQCSVCGRLYSPERAPAAGRACYCPACRGSAAMWRAIKRRQRTRRLDFRPGTG